ncbi:hypothetical protein FKQ61_31235 [Vibrio sp. A14(2019)]|nr:hypothetical protein [Vibrio sp. A14(2019)]
MYKVMRKNLDVIQINSNRNRCFFMHLRFRNKIFLLLTFLLLIQFLYMAWGQGKIMNVFCAMRG